MRFYLVLVTALFFTVPALAQQSNDRAVTDRLNQIQRQMDTISRQVYSGNPPPAAISTSTGSSDSNSGLAAAVDERISSIEGTLQQINNRLDEQDYALGQLKQQYDMLKSDIDVRFKDIGSKAALDSTTSAIATTPDVANAPTPTDTGTGEMTRTDTTAATPSDAGAVKALPTDSSAALYDSSFQLLREQKYTEAQAGFQEFLKRYATDPLAGNAQYWLGETYYVQAKYPEAAKIFAQGYKKYPKSSKAPDNLLKLGLSLSQSGKKQDACVTLQQLGTQYSNAAAVIKQRATDEIKKLNCGAPAQG